MSTISIDSIISVPPGVTSCDLGDEIAILQIDSGRYYGLDPVGARIWGLVQEPGPVSAARDALIDEYEVAPSECETELLSFLGHLLEARLIEVKDAPTAPQNGSRS